MLDEHGLWEGPPIDERSLDRWGQGQSRNGGGIPPRRRTSKRRAMKALEGLSRLSALQASLGQTVGGITAPITPLNRSSCKVIADAVRRMRHRKNLDGNITEPCIVEFAGTPRTGKDTTISIVKDFLEDVYEYTVRVIDEPSRQCRSGQGLNRDTICRSANRIVAEVYQARCENPGDYDFVFLNRGIFDTLTFLLAAHHSGVISESLWQSHALYLSAYAEFEDIVLLMLISPDEAIRREEECKRNYVLGLAELENLPVRSQRILNRGTLSLLDRLYHEAYSRYRHAFLIFALGLSGDPDSEIRRDQYSVLAKSLACLDVILPEDPAQLPFPELFEVYFVDPHMREREHGANPSGSSPRTHQNCSAVQLSFPAISAFP